MQLVSNPKVNHPEPLSLQVVCNHSLWLKDMYEYYSSHDKDLCRDQCPSLIGCLSKLPSPCSNSAVPVLHGCCIDIAGCHKGLFLVNSCNSGNNCNCQNNKCFFAVQQQRELSDRERGSLRSAPTLPSTPHTWLTEAMQMILHSNFKFLDIRSKGASRSDIQW